MRPLPRSIEHDRRAVEAGRPIGRLAGDTWLAYASRFGEYRAFAKQPGAEDYLPAGIERTPARSDTYAALADFYGDKGRLGVLAEYDHAAALNAGRSDVHLRAAAIRRGPARAAATARWRQAPQPLDVRRRDGSGGAARHGARRDRQPKLLPELRDPADKMVWAHVTLTDVLRQRLRATFRAAGDAASGTDWLIALAPAAPSPIDFRLHREGRLAADLSTRSRLRADRGRRRGAVARAHGDEQLRAKAQPNTWRFKRIRRSWTRNRRLRTSCCAGCPTTWRRTTAMSMSSRRIASPIAPRDPLDRCTRDEPAGRNIDALGDGRHALRRTGEGVSARRTRSSSTCASSQRRADPPVVLGWPRSDPAGKHARRAGASSAASPWSSARPSTTSRVGALLERLNHPAEAREFRRARAQAVPWDAAAQIAPLERRLRPPPTDEASVAPSLWLRARRQSRKRGACLRR